MKTQISKSQTALTKRDITFLKFLDNGTYSGTSRLQLPERDRLRMIIDFFDIIFFLIDACYQRLKKRKNAGRAAIANLANALRGKFPNVSLDYSKVNILGGSLAAPCATMHQNYGSSKLSFSWSRCTQCNSNESDELMAMIYCPESKEFWSEQNLGITRGDRFCTLDVPIEFDGKQVHVWLAYRSADGRENSNSSYMGEVLIKSDPDGDY
ncbi:DUF6266 family protein [Daejeonella lutea]|uniref:Uncharacterized protein n=1 Tax=Daejeonella lutea TaxID=572036 RepID=A0A1T5DYH2_9SPHI|nr:DUF6266 family protein [Daejeonella lutea]SKB76610.1 hypothetical protein SAMN05661099_2732 [Daejeonella lutea]